MDGVVRLGLLTLLAFAPLAQAANCTASGYQRDGFTLTAALVNPTGVVSGEVDATGCHIGIYFGPGVRGKVERANVHGANYFGIVNNGAEVDIQDSTLSDIGEKPFNGTQHGVAIYFVYGSAARGEIRRNLVWNYQKGGIVVNGALASATIENNRVIGLGPVSFIAQNGIQAGWGAHTKIRKNLVSGHSYTGANLAASGGILVLGGACYGGAATTETEIAHNVALGNDVGIWLSNLDGSCGPVTTPTNNVVRDNRLVNNALNNRTGNGAAQGYQAGIADQGYGDVIRNNDVCGPGYQPPGTAAVALFAIDVTATYEPVLRQNTQCSDAGRDLGAGSVPQRTRRGHESRRADHHH
ncbi:MAG: hypothetical protein OEW21_10215 [Betaproteobacteria bacterium]|nr:hypothetical protein [Betaproteobacteria bacterium]